MVKKENALFEKVHQQIINKSIEKSFEFQCKNCNYVNEESSIYCSECGYVIKEQVICPKCKSVARDCADICEICGTWLLIGQCMFCYADIAEDENFCGECGNPTQGFTCHRCGEHSIFDFCKSCGTPLSRQAKEMVQEISQDPFFYEMKPLFEKLANSEKLSPTAACASAHIVADNTATCSSQNDQLVRLKAYREACHQVVPKPMTRSVTKSLFSSEQKSRISHLNQEVFQEEERRRIAEENRRREEERQIREEWLRSEREGKLHEQLNEYMRQFSGKTFASSQEARRFFMNLIAGLPDEIIKKLTGRGLSWRCNAYSCEHNSPGDCADPSRGGVWLIR